MMKRKMMAAVLTMAMAAAMIGGCGNSTDTSNAGNSTNTTESSAATISLYHVPPIAVFAQVKTDSQLNKFMLEANPITAILIVYNPVFTMIPAKMD